MSTSRRRQTVKILAIGIAIVVAAAMVVLVMTPQRESVTWLTPGAPLQQSILPPGRLQMLKIRLQIWAAPILQKLSTARAQVVIETLAIAVPEATNWLGAVKSAAIDTRDGVHVWVLPSDQWKPLADQLKATPQADLLGNLRMSTIERMQSQMALSGRAVIDGKPVAVGTELRFLTRAGKDNVRLTLNAEITEQLHQFTASARTAPVTNSVLQTNLAAALQASVPDGGALVLARETTNNIQGRVLWLIISPTQVKAPTRP